METRNCSGCERTYFVLADSCPDHCGPVCCRKMYCERARPKYTPMPRKCRVCRTSSVPGLWSGFERFAPCDEGCSRLYYHTEQVYRCLIHHPNGKPRYHINYCSIKCYNSEYKGFLETRRQRGRRRRLARADYKRGRRALYGREGEKSQKDWWAPLGAKARH